MQGHLRRRGSSWEYIVDIGRAAAQRCADCNKRIWIERRPHDECPDCGGPLRETEERRRAVKGGYATRKEAAAAMHTIITADTEQRFVAPSRLSVREYLTKEWLPAIEATVRPSTYFSYVQHVECHLVPHIGNQRLQTLSGAQINVLYATLARCGKQNGQGLSPRTIHHVHAVLHRACRDAVRWNRLSRNPVEAADPPRISDALHEMTTWSAKQLAAFLDSVRDSRLHPLWHTLAMTGLRRGEALGLRWEDVDLENARLSVRRALIPCGREVVASEPKTARGRRSVALDGETVEVLRGQAARQLEEQTGSEDWTDSGLVFTKDDGEALHPEDVTRYFRIAVRKAMLPRIRLHDLRHTHATLALAAGIHPKVVSERLGHATVSFTLDVYSHAIPAMQEEAAERIAGLVLAAR